MTHRLSSLCFAVKHALSRTFAPAAIVAAVACGLTPNPARANTSAFTYQGELAVAGELAEGVFDLRFRLVDEGGSPTSEAVCVNNVPVAGGRFTVHLDFGPEAGRERTFLEVQVREDDGRDCSDETGLVTLVPTQEVTPLLRSVFANFAGNANSLNGQSAAFFTNPANLTGGTLPDTALSVNVPRLAAENTFLGATNTFGNVAVNGWIGSETGAVQVRANGQRALLIQQDFGAPRITMGSPLNSVGSGAAGANILGGEGNRVDSTFGTIVGGSNNRLGNTSGIVNALGSVIGGGVGNEVQGTHGVISGGLFNRIEANRASVGGGERNAALAPFATIAGGGPSNAAEPSDTNNRVLGSFGTIGGGGNNRAGSDTGLADDRPFPTVSGGRDNRATSEFSTIAGGSGNRAATQFASIGGGVNNFAGGGGFTTIAGGSENDATGFVATIAGGDFNIASGERAFVGGGNANLASGRFTSLAGGTANVAAGEASALGGGANNLVGGAFATVPGGANNEASGFASLAAGWGGQAIHDGALVWADASQSGVPLPSTAPNQLVIRASGGLRLLGTNNAPRLTIDSTGAVVVPGPLAASSFAYPAPVTRFRAYAAGAFVPGTLGGDEIPRRSGAFSEKISGSGESTLHLPLDLPDGSRITGLRITCQDTDPGRSMDFWLVQTSLDTGVATLVTSASTQIFVGDVLHIEIPVAPSILVDNANSTLELVVLPDNSAGPFNDWSNRIAIIGTRVRYTVTSPTP